MTLTLYIGNKNYSSWSLRPWLALKQSGLDFREEKILLDTPTTKQEIQRISPAGRVPILRHDDLTVWDSLAICEYVAELAPDKGLWPADAKARAVARAVSAEMHSGFAALRGALTMNIRRHYPGFYKTPAVHAEIARVHQIWNDCRSRFGKGGDFLFGRLSIADAIFAPVVTRFATYDVKSDPICDKYRQAMWELPALREWREGAAREEEVIDDSEYAP